MRVIGQTAVRRAQDAVDDLVRQIINLTGLFLNLGSDTFGRAHHLCISATQPRWIAQAALDRGQFAAQLVERLNAWIARAL